jgi:hypothetical protein
MITNIGTLDLDHLKILTIEDFPSKPPRRDVNAQVLFVIFFWM